MCASLPTSGSLLKDEVSDRLWSLSEVQAVMMMTAFWHNFTGVPPWPGCGSVRAEAGATFPGGHQGSSAAHWVLSVMPHLWHTYVITSYRSSCVGWVPLQSWALPWVEGVKMEVLQQLTLMKLCVLALIEDLAGVKDVNVHNHTRVWCLSFIICTNQSGVPLHQHCGDTE